MSEIKHVIITTCPARGDDPGACEIGHYKVESGMVVMCSEEGRSTSQKRKLLPGDDPERVAGRMLREAWHRRAPENNFNRPLVYPIIGRA